MILSHDRERGRVSLSTKKLEPTPGDMIRNPKLVFEKVGVKIKNMCTFAGCALSNKLTWFLWLTSGRRDGSDIQAENISSRGNGSC